MFWSGGRYETRSSALAGIAVQRELRHQQQTTAHIRKSQIHFSVGIAEKAQPCYFVHHPLQFRLPIRLREPYQEEKSGTDLTSNVAWFSVVRTNANFRSTYTL